MVLRDAEKEELLRIRRGEMGNIRGSREACYERILRLIRFGQRYARQRVRCGVERTVVSVVSHGAVPCVWILPAKPAAEAPAPGESAAASTAEAAAGAAKAATRTTKTSSRTGTKGACLHSSCERAG